MPVMFFTYLPIVTFIAADDRRGPPMDPRDQPRDPRGPPPEQRFGPPSGPRDPRGDRGPSGPPPDGRFSGPVHSPQQQWGPNQGGPPPMGPQGESSHCHHHPGCQRGLGLQGAGLKNVGQQGSKTEKQGL